MDPFSPLSYGAFGPCYLVVLHHLSVIFSEVKVTIRLTMTKKKKTICKLETQDTALLWAYLDSSASKDYQRQ